MSIDAGNLVENGSLVFVSRTGIGSRRESQESQDLLQRKAIKNRLFSSEVVLFTHG